MGKAPIHKRVARKDIWISSDTFINRIANTGVTSGLPCNPFFLWFHTLQGHLPASVSVRFLGGGGGSAPSQPLKSSESAPSRTAIYIFFFLSPHIWVTLEPRRKLFFLESILISALASAQKA